jgi:molybdenum cofactor synthesis domain-containing protein
VRVILASDRVSRGQREDGTAGGLRQLLEQAGYEFESAVAVPDDLAALSAAIVEAAKVVPLVLTSGGTGIAPRDVTPEATRAVIERELLGFGEAMRAASREATPTADLSRATAGTLGSSLVVNLPGSPKGAVECLAAVLPSVGHGLRLLAGAVKDCALDVSSTGTSSPREG